MSNTINTFDSEHQGTTYDVQFDYYGKKMASAGSDGKINIFEITQENTKKISEILGHDGSVWKVSWSHPRFGSLLASCGFDKKINIWKESSHNKWDKIYEYNEHKNSVNTICFAPEEYGLILIGGSSDGNISIHEYKNEVWSAFQFFGHGFGVNSLSWAPPLKMPQESTLGASSNTPLLRFVSGGMDNVIRVWHTKDNMIKSCYTAATLEGHEDFVRTVAWRPNLNSGFDTIASGGDDCVVYLWIGSSATSIENDNDSTENSNSEWNKFELKKFDCPISNLAWDENGNHLAVTSSDGAIYLFKEDAESAWNLASMTNSEGVMENIKENDENN